MPHWAFLGGLSRGWKTKGTKVQRKLGNQENSD